MARKKLSELPKVLRAYQFLGLDIDYREGVDNVETDCPWCGAEGKFSINLKKDGLWRCFVCQEGIDDEHTGGNLIQFIRMFHAKSYEATTDYTPIKTDRRLLREETLVRWEVARSYLNDRWLIPAYDPKGKLSQLYQYCRTEKGMRLLATPGLGHQLFGQYDPEAAEYYILEGPWDAMAFWEMMGSTKLWTDGFKETSNYESSLLKGVCVLAVPGCGSIGEPFERFLPLFKNKVVNVLLDSDHPRTNKAGRVSLPAGYTATKKAIGMLTGCKEPPSGVYYLNWGEKGYDPDRPSGTDVRDCLVAAGYSVRDRIPALDQLFRQVEEAPEEFIKESGTLDPSMLPTAECDSYDKLISAWKAALSWTIGLEDALSVMLSSIISTNSAGDQLWVKVIGPPSCGKSTLCEAVSVARSQVLSVSTVRGFFSGYQADREGKEDNSLVIKANGRCLVTKDADPMLQAPNLGQILSEGRDIYDRNSRTQYRNKMSREYSNINMTWILCGTSALKTLDESELGARFLDCVIMEGIDDDLEDDIAWIKAQRARSEIGIQSNGQASKSQDPNLIQAMQMTGGYIEHLCKEPTKLLSRVNVSDEHLRKCARLGKFVSFMRARPSRRQSEVIERELSARLVSQLVRLMLCLTVVLGKSKTDREVLRRTTKVAMDTSRGKSFEIISRLFASGDKGLTPYGLENYTGHSKGKVLSTLRFLRKLGAVETYTRKSKSGQSTPAWRVTEQFAILYEEVCVD